MSWGRTVLSITILGATVAGFTTFNNTQTQHQFYYYPALNTYYDVQLNRFIYTIDGGTSWSSMSAGTSIPDLGDKVILSSETSKVWKVNSEHLAKYGGLKLNLVENMQWKVRKPNTIEKPKSAKATVSKNIVEGISSIPLSAGLDSAEMKLRDEVMQEAKENQNSFDTTQINPESSRPVADTTKYW